MKTFIQYSLRSLALVLSFALMQPAFAGFGDNHGFGGSHSGGGFSFGGGDSSGGHSHFGGSSPLSSPFGSSSGMDLANSILQQAMASSSTPSHSSGTSSTTSTYSGPMYDTTVQGPSWSESLFNPEVNPVRTFTYLHYHFVTYNFQVPIYSTLNEKSRSHSFAKYV